jgi:hypothetical protein
MDALCKLRCSMPGKAIRRMLLTRNKRSITAPCATAEPASANTLLKWKPRRRSPDAKSALTTPRPQILGSTGCQPVVAGSPAGNIFAHAILRQHGNLPGLGKLPRPAGWQPALPLIQGSGFLGLLFLRHFIDFASVPLGRPPLGRHPDQLI